MARYKPYNLKQDKDFEYTWRGVLGMSLNGAQFFGRVAPEIFASAAYNGVGVAFVALQSAFAAFLHYWNLLGYTW